MTILTPAPRRGLVRSGTVLAALATLLALWFGLTAPASSPVAPPPPAAEQVATDGTATQPVLPADARPRGRRG